MKKIVLAYSGGLDTSYCAKYLSESNYEVHAVCVNTGGFNENEIQEIKTKAIALGVTDFRAINAVNAYYDKVIRFLIYGNVLKNNTYPLSVSAERIVQAIEVCNYAKSIGARCIAHGSTGAGNDQVRFDLIFQTMIPDIEIITPIRDNTLSRQEEIEYLKNKGVNLSWEKAKYSINKGLWGTSVGGAETLTSNLPLPEASFPSQLKNTETEKLTISFNKGEVTAVNGVEGSPVENIQKIQAIASQYAIGRDIHVGDTILGIKGRVGF
ncbi:MAG: argininosuccinate synthase, partial [Bacteroidia bacterium]|nr:argininosuccinate synthase [Bacteroidia bacterium]